MLKSIERFKMQSFQFSIDSNLADTKLFACCRKKCLSLSKKQMKECFVRNNIYINAMPIRNGAEAEAIRVKEHDIIDIIHNSDEDFAEKLSNMHISALYCSSNVYIFDKLAGVNAAIRSDYEKALKNNSWGIEFGHIPFRLSKNMTGLYMCVKTHADLVQSLKDIFNGNIKLIFTCIVIGIVGEVGSTVLINDCEVDGIYFALSAHVLSVSECRFSNFISLIEVTPQWSNVPEQAGPSNEIFDRSSNTANIGDSGVISLCIKNIKVALNKVGHTVVGDGDVVKSSKGVYMILNKIELNGDRWKNGVSNESVVEGSCATPSIVELSIPNKFKLLIEREKELYVRAQSKTSNLITAWVKAQFPYKDADVDVHSDIVRAAIVQQVEYITKLLCDKGFDIEILGAGGANPQNASEFADWCNQIHAKWHIPIEYLLRECCFCDLSFVVDPTVMIPRKSSESLVDAAIEEYVSIADGVDLHDRKYASVLDMGTGSGCLLVSALVGILNSCLAPGCSASSLHHEQILGLTVGTDISTEALNIARENVQRHALDSVRLIQCPFNETHKLVDTCVQSDSKCANHFIGFDIILCNPPYSTRHQKSRISRCKLDMEPELALLSQNSYDCYKDIVYALNHHDDKDIKYPIMHRDSILIFEIGAGQHEDVQMLLNSVNALQFRKYIYDYNGIIRGLMYKRSSYNKLNE